MVNIQSEDLIREIEEAETLAQESAGYAVPRKVTLRSFAQASDTSGSKVHLFGLKGAQ